MNRIAIHVAQKALDAALEEWHRPIEVPGDFALRWEKLLLAAQALKRAKE